MAELKQLEIEERQHLRRKFALAIAGPMIGSYLASPTSAIKNEELAAAVWDIADAMVRGEP